MRRKKETILLDVYNFDEKTKKITSSFLKETKKIIKKNLSVTGVQPHTYKGGFKNGYGIGKIHGIREAKGIFIKLFQQIFTSDWNEKYGEKPK